MPASEPILPLDSFSTFGDLLKYLRKRVRLTQREVAIAVGYSEAQISRLEQNQRPPDLATVTALFIPALYVDDEPEAVARLLELASQARGMTFPQDGRIIFSHSVQRDVLENVTTIEENLLSNLPLQLTSFVGRKREMDEIANWLDKARLVTLTGSGGCGKTRVALETAKGLADSYRDGVWLVELASISDANLVVQAITSTLGVPESREAVSTSTLTNYFRARQLLLIMDNCEQVVAAVAQIIEEILKICPQVKVLATSREVLKVPGEIQYRVSPLSLAENKSSQSEAVSLFLDRAQGVLPSFDLTEENLSDVSHICRLVDGVPLGIELAAAKVSVLSANQIASRLNESFTFLAAGRANNPHQQTLEATIEWSYELLSEEERLMLQRLSIFSGGWTLDAAESITSDEATIPEGRVLELLSQLVNKSLVVVDIQSSVEARYGLLRMVRQYGSDRLDQSGEREKIKSRHFDFFLGLVNQAYSGIMTAQSPYWFNRLDPEQNNLRTALANGSSMKRYENILQMAGGLFWFWQTRGHISEGRSQLESALTQSLNSTHPNNPEYLKARARALWAAGALAWIQADYAAARSLIEESLSLWKQSKPGDNRGLAISLREAGIIAIYQDELGYAHRVLEESIGIFEKVGDSWDLALAYYNHGLVHESENDFHTARDNFQRSLMIFRELNEPWGLSVALNGFGRIAGRQKDYSTARLHLEESLMFSQKLEDPWSNAGTLYLLGETAYLQNDMEHATELFIESLNLNRVVGDKAMIGFTIHQLGKLAKERGKLERAAQLFGAALPLRNEASNTTAWSLTDNGQFENDIEAVRAILEVEIFESAWIKGQAMNMDDAIEFALT